MTSFKHTMLDLETMGSSPGCAIASIGAVRFDPHAGIAPDVFYEVVDLRSCTDRGLRLEPATVLWWLKQSRPSREEIGRLGTELSLALCRFETWLDPDTMIWSHGSSFDLPVLGAAYTAAGLRQPWKFRNERDTRTIMWLTETPAHLPDETAHHALEDARRQALTVIKALRKYKGVIT